MSRNLFRSHLIYSEIAKLFLDKYKEDHNCYLHIMSQCTFFAIFTAHDYSKIYIDDRQRCSDARWWMHQRDQSTSNLPQSFEGRKKSTARPQLGLSRKKKEESINERRREKEKTMRRLNPSRMSRWDWIWQARAARWRWMPVMRRRKGQEGARGWSLVSKRMSEGSRREKLGVG